MNMNTLCSRNGALGPLMINGMKPQLKYRDSLRLREPINSLRQLYVFIVLHCFFNLVWDQKNFSDQNLAFFSKENSRNKIIQSFVLGNKQISNCHSKISEGI